MKPPPFPDPVALIRPQAAGSASWWFPFVSACIRRAATDCPRATPAAAACCPPESAAFGLTFPKTGRGSSATSSQQCECGRAGRQVDEQSTMHRRMGWVGFPISRCVYYQLRSPPRVRPVRWESREAPWCLRKSFEARIRSTSAPGKGTPIM